eukprot:2849798-Prymnesium_polylepis.1
MRPRRLRCDPARSSISHGDFTKNADVTTTELTAARRAVAQSTNGAKKRGPCTVNRKEAEHDGTRSRETERPKFNATKRVRNTAVREEGKSKCAVYTPTPRDSVPQ